MITGLLAHEDWVSQGLQRPDAGGGQCARDGARSRLALVLLRANFFFPQAVSDVSLAIWQPESRTLVARSPAPKAPLASKGRAIYLGRPGLAVDYSPRYQPTTLLATFRSSENSLVSQSPVPFFMAPTAGCCTAALPHGRSLPAKGG